jgi:hypothetical protein
MDVADRYFPKHANMSGLFARQSDVLAGDSAPWPWPQMPDPSADGRDVQNGARPDDNPNVTFTSMQHGIANGRRV